MSAQVTITQLPTAGAITGTELVPIVQNGQTVKTTTAALAGSPVQTQTFITKNQEPTLANSRALSNGTGVGLVDGGAQSTLQITLNAASGSLEAASNGMIAKTASNAVVARTMTTSTTGLSVTNGDGVAGAPDFALTGVALAVAGATGTGALALTSPTTVSTRTIFGTVNQIDVTDGNFVNSPVIAIASDAVLPGSGGIVIPAGTTGQRGSSTLGNIRYNSDTGLFEGYNGAWTSFASGSGVTSVATGTGLTGGPITSTGTISLANTAVVAGTYTASNITVDAQGRITAAANGSGGGGGTVTSIDVSGGTTGLTTSGGPVTTAGTITLAGTLAVANGGTGTSTPAIVAGTNVTVSGSWPNQTINASSSGDVAGPASATDNAITRFDLTTGKLVQNSLVTIADDGAITAPQVGSVIPFYYANQAAFPSAATYHGALAHSHTDGAMFFAHGSVWNRLLDDVTDVTVAQGGTGLSTLTANNVILGNGTSTPLFVAPSTSGNVLTSNGTTWASTAPATSGTVTSVAFSGGTTGLTVTGSPITTSGTITLAGTLAVANGGTGAVNATDARTNLVAAKSGTNSDITELYALNGTSYGVAYQNAGNQLIMGSALTFDGSMLFVPGGISGGTF